MAAPPKQLHVVAVPLAAQGHMNPLMRFCKVLASQGVLVTFVNIDPVHHRIEELLQQHVEPEAEKGAKHGHDHTQPKIRRAHVPIQGLDLANDFRVSCQSFFEAQGSIASPLEALILEITTQCPPVTCLITDIILTSATQSVAEKFNIPWVVLVPSSASELLLIHYVMQGKHISMQEVLEKLSRRAITKEVLCEGLPALPTIYNDEAPCFNHMNGDETAYMWMFMTRAWKETVHRAHAIVCNSFDELEGPALRTLSDELGLPIYGVGPLVQPLHHESSTSLWKENEECIPWLDQQPPLSVLYISFGSATLLSQPQFEEILAGLVSSKQQFLWVFRPDLVRNMPTYAAFASHILSRSLGKGYVVDWAPQLRVLSHPSVGGFFTHCGWNSTLEAISHGVPMICWPYLGDQFLHAKYIVQEWKIGLRCQSTKNGSGQLVDRCEVERAIKTLMEGQEGQDLRKNAMSLKGASIRSLLRGGTSYKSAQGFIESLM